MHASLLKTVGYLISTLSVVMLGAVAWDSAADNAMLRAAVLLGVAASIAGMALRWLSYQMAERDEAAPKPARARPTR